MVIHVGLLKQFLGQRQVLDAKEVARVVGQKAFAAADPDNDGTLTKDETA